MQSGGNLGQFDIHTQYTMHVAFGSIDYALCLWHRVVVYHAWHDPTTSEITHEVGGTTSGDGIECGRHTSREALACLAMQLQFLRGVPVVDAVERGRFQQDIARSCMNFRVGAAHDACNSNRAERIGDQQHRFIEFSLNTIQGGHLLARIGPTHYDGWLGTSRFFSSLDKQVVVECVQRLSPFQHYIVRNIYDVTDGAHSGFYQPILHPFG